MEILDRVGDFFGSIVGGVDKLLRRFMGGADERFVKKLGFIRNADQTRIIPGSLLDRISSLEPEWEKKSDDELRQSAAIFRQQIAQGRSLDDLLPEAFAAVRESAKRMLKMRHYDVQMIGGYVLHTGRIAEMVTGEGKTLVSTLPAFLNALAGKVHIVTVNDYLALRDMEWMGPVHLALGLTVGAIQSDQEIGPKAKAYQCDITYGTNNEFGFDYLRDNMKPRRNLQVQGPLNFAIVDEIDNILIDEARTPLIIAGQAHDDVRKYSKAHQVAMQLKVGAHFEIKEKEHSVNLTEDGIREAEKLAGVESFYTPGNMEWPHLLDNSLKAIYLYKRDVNYVVQQGQVVIVDEFTGRLMAGRHWSDGLHQAVEAKEGVTIKPENQTVATITLQNFFKLYKKLAGMTGTAATEASEFMKIYNLEVIPTPTNRPMKRSDGIDQIFGTEKEKFDAIIREIRDIHKQGRPILVGTVSIEKSEVLSSKLSKFGIKHEVLNAKHHEREAEIIAQAGRLGAVTIATNMAGRGTDIILGGNPEQLAWEQLKHTYESRLDVPKAEWDALSKSIADQEGMYAEGRKVADSGGLHVIGSERHEARRIDLQLRGRSGRQGDPGSSRFFLSLEDDLMRIFGGDWFKRIMQFAGLKDGEAIEHPMLNSQIAKAQRKREEHNFEIRKQLLEYDEVMDTQRKRVYTYRQRILDGYNCRTLVMTAIETVLKDRLKEFLNPDYAYETCASFVEREFGLSITARDLRGLDLEVATQVLRDEGVSKVGELIREQIETDFPDDVEDQRDWNWGAFTRWCNVRFGLNFNERDLRKVERNGLYDLVSERAVESINRQDFSAIDIFLKEDFSRKSLVAWLEHQFTLRMDPEEFKDKSKEDALDLVIQKLDTHYSRKDIEFPVAVGLKKYMPDGAGGGERADREGLARWTNARFGTTLAPDHFQKMPRDEVRQELLNISGNFRGTWSTQDLNRIILESYGEPRGKTPENDPPKGSLQELVNQLGEKIRLHVSLDEIEGKPRGVVENRVLQGVDKKYRSELYEGEQILLVHTIDSAWKDHLYYMDHLRQGIGLSGYAGKDPKVEFKREGMRAYEFMWRRISEQVSSGLFRLEDVNPDFVGSLWQITGLVHEQAPTPQQQAQPEASPNTSGDNSKAVEPIRNFGKKVGRNDPCPCGSGKKFKNCCMT